MFLLIFMDVLAVEIEIKYTNERKNGSKLGDKMLLSFFFFKINFVNAKIPALSKVTYFTRTDRAGDFYFLIAARGLRIHCLNSYLLRY